MFSTGPLGGLGMVMDEKLHAVVRHPWVDSLGTMIAVACAIQCAALPVLISLLPFQSLVTLLSFMGPWLLLSGGLEKFLLVTAGALAVGSFSWGFRSHRRFYIFLFLVAAAGLVLIGRVWANNWHQIPFVVAGSLVLAVGHVLNRRLCRLCAACTGHAENGERSALRSGESQNSALANRSIG